MMMQMVDSLRSERVLESFQQGQTRSKAQKQKMVATREGHLCDSEFIGR